MNFKITNIKDKLFTCFLLLLILALFIFIGFRCPAVALLGIPCPGCGMTRAYLALLRFDFAEAFKMHSMFWSMPILLIYYFTDWKLFKNKLINNGILILIGVGFLINWAVHMIL